MTMDEGTTVESRPSSPDSEGRSFAVLEFENNVADEESGKTGQRKRKSPKGKGKGKWRKKGCRTDDVDKPSEAFHQPEPTGKEKPVRVLLIIEKRSPPQVLKILKDRLLRRMKNDESADMSNCIQVLKMVIKYEVKSFFSTIAEKLDKISTKWPARADLINIQKDINEEQKTRHWSAASDLDIILNELNNGQWHTASDLDNILKNMGKKHNMSKQATLFVKMFHRFEAIEQKIKESDKIRAKDSTKLRELENIFCVEGVSEETLSDKISTVCTSLFLEENATNKLSKDNIIEDILATKVVNKETTKEKLVLEGNPIYNIPGNVAEEYSAAGFFHHDSLFSEEANATNKHGGILHKSVEDLKRELIDENKCDVEVSDFHGLQDEINSAEDNFPDRLKPIAMKIEQDRKEGTPANKLYQRLLVLVSAAVKEMQELPDNKLSMPILRKWAATSNLANRMQFQVPYFENSLDKNMRAYLSYSTMNPSSEN
ncbi:uncharacterized protein LOC120150819 [Hibiscus syriacus]|uniref:uncharacterized protein LOC120150819 n=1 Tax=Hibiscus syriacus TaxID=106335 RepID=UPI001924EA24|nr:uncharacterized protein LOC120150819 [Hibiscus syriacus]